MNILKKLYCRTFQGVLRIALPFLPYRKPKILKNNDEVVKILASHKKLNVFLMTDNTIEKLRLIDSLKETLKNNNIKVTIFTDITPNPTTDNVANALQVYKENSCDSIIAFGGGSVMDCAKAMGARVVCPKKCLAKMKGIMKVMKRLPLLIAVPTTAGTGSETTLAAVITDSQTRHKYAINSFPLIPHYALLDANLTIGLPKFITATTGMDALTHAIEAYIGRSTTKETRKMALEAINAILNNILEVYENPTNLEARNNMLLASFKAGVAFTQSYVGYVHAIAHSLGGKYNTPHGLANAVILPYVLKSFGKSVYKKLWKIGISVNLFNQQTSYEEGARLFIDKIEGLNAKMNIPNKIDVLCEEDISSLAKTAEKEANPLYPVPKLFTVKELEKIYYQILK